jgi:hypothetical protein
MYGMSGGGPDINFSNFSCKVGNRQIDNYIVEPLLCTLLYATYTQCTEASTWRTSSQNVWTITENVYDSLLCNLEYKYNLINVCLST